MFDTLADVPAVWVALGVVGLTFVSVVTDLPAEPAPDAAAVGATVDEVAASPHPTTARHPITATAIKLGPRTVALRNAGGTTHTEFAFGPVTPVGRTGPLRRVLRGEPPEEVFESRAAFRRALQTARERPPRWRTAGDAVRVRGVSWGDVDATLVGA